jgi:hypothetical protein
MLLNHSVFLLIETNQRQGITAVVAAALAGSILTGEIGFALLRVDERGG